MKAACVLAVLLAVASARKPVQHCRTIPRPGGAPVVSCETVVADPSTVKGSLIVEGAITSNNEIRVAYDEAGGGNCTVGALSVAGINALNMYSGSARVQKLTTRGLDAPPGSRAITMAGKMRVRGQVTTGAAKASTAMFLQEQAQWGLVQEHTFAEHDHGYKN